MRVKEFGAAHLEGRCHGTLLCDSFKFPHHSGFMPSSFEFPSDLNIHSSFEFHPKLRSVFTLPSAFTNDSVTLSVGLLSGALQSQACVELDKRPSRTICTSA